MARDSNFVVRPLGFPWETRDPFLFCVHHLDFYPRSNGAYGPQASLSGRNLGNDFEGIDGWRMYHGQTIPGFPPHPHRGFETVTLARRGFIDHSDSLGAAARFGQGDVQWITTGKGIVHSEMFPLLRDDEPNTVELFQIWLNLPAESKLVDPHFSIFWSEDVPVVKAGEGAEAVLVAGRLWDAQPADPPPRSWAARPDNEVAIVTLRLTAGGHLTIPSASPGVNRSLFFFEGDRITLGEQSFEQHSAIHFVEPEEVTLTGGDEPTELLLLQGKPIAEPVAQYGPFVMNSADEIRQAIRDYQSTEFGGWPWDSNEPVHADKGRFARHIDGREEHK